MVANKNRKQHFVSKLFSDKIDVWSDNICVPGSVLHSPWQVYLLYWHFDPHLLYHFSDHPPRYHHHEEDADRHLISDDLGHPGSLPLHRHDPLLQARVHHLRVHLITNVMMMMTMQMMTSIIIAMTVMMTMIIVVMMMMMIVMIIVTMQMMMTQHSPPGQVALDK